MKLQADIRRSKFYTFLKLDIKWNVNFDRFKVEEFPHNPVFNKCINFLRKRGWEVTRDPRIEKDYKILGKYHRYGKKGDLECDFEIYPMGMSFDFYQNINVINQYGGRSDIDRWDLMPYLIRLSFINETNRLMTFFSEEVGCTLTEQDKRSTSEAEIIHHFQTKSFTRNKIVSLDEIQSMMSSYDLSCNNNDRDKKKILCGDIKYFRQRTSGRLMRGRVYHNINNMWWVILNPTSFTNIADFELFDPTPEDFHIRRYKKKRIPETIIEKHKSLSAMSDSELRKELQRRKKKQPSPVI